MEKHRDPHHTPQPWNPWKNGKAKIGTWKEVEAHWRMRLCVPPWNRLTRRNKKNNHHNFYDSGVGIRGWSCGTHREMPARSKLWADNLRTIRCPGLDSLMFRFIHESLERRPAPPGKTQEGRALVSGNNEKDRMKMCLVTSASFSLNRTWHFPKYILKVHHPQTWNQGVSLFLLCQSLLGFLRI